MSKYFSKTENAFYDSEVIPTDEMPEDKVLVSESDYEDLLDKQCQGYKIVGNEAGYPVAQEQSCGKCTTLVHETVKASSSELGHVKVGDNLSISEDGTLSVADVVTGIKGNNETEYRNGNVNLTADDVGAAYKIHKHDDLYYTESEIDTKLNGKANSNHTHDDRYYTESEIDTKLEGKANSSHNQASSTINAMTGYSKPSSTSAIAVGDSLNSAIGKLEKALDGKQASGSYAAASHTHNYAGSSSAGGSANSVKMNLAIKLNGGTKEGTNLFTFNGSTAKTVNITPSGIGAAASSHGNHVPATQTANNATFLRNDNTWQKVTPANIGAAASSHGNHVPATQTANNATFLRNDNTWQKVTPANIGAAASTVISNDLYSGWGKVITSADGKTYGYGQLHLIKLTNNRVIVHFCAQIYAVNTDENYTYGFDPSNIKSITGFPSKLTALDGMGSWSLLSAPDGATVNQMGAGTLFNLESGYLVPARRYNISGSVGGYPSKHWTPAGVSASTGTILTGFLILAY